MLRGEPAESDFIANRVELVDRAVEERDERPTLKRFRDAPRRLPGGEEARVPIAGAAQPFLEEFRAGALVHRAGGNDLRKVARLVDRFLRHDVGRARAALLVTEDF